MDVAALKAQRQVGRSSKKSSKAKQKKKRYKRLSQSAGQPTGPRNAAGSSSRARRRQIDRIEDASAVENGACTKKCISFTVGALHTIDACLGLACVVYGGMAHVVNVTAILIIYGLVLIIGAVAGGIGYYSGGCNKRGLTASSIAGLLICLADIAAFVFVIISWGSFITFLKENAEALLLTDASISTISSLRILFAIIFIVLAVLEVSR